MTKTTSTILTLFGLASILAFFASCEPHALEETKVLYHHGHDDHNGTHDKDHKEHKGDGDGKAGKEETSKGKANPQPKAAKGKGESKGKANSGKNDSKKGEPRDLGL